MIIRILNSKKKDTETIKNKTNNKQNMTRDIEIKNKLTVTRGQCGGG